MYGSGVLLLTKPLCSSLKHYKVVLEKVSKLVQKGLIVQFQPGLHTSLLAASRSPQIQYTQQLRACVSELYGAASIYPNIDTRILLTNVGERRREPQTELVKNEYDVIFVDQGFPDESNSAIQKHVSATISDNAGKVDVDVIKLDTPNDNGGDSVDHVIRTFPHVCGGGTFDR